LNYEFDVKTIRVLETKPHLWLENENIHRGYKQNGFQIKTPINQLMKCTNLGWTSFFLQKYEQIKLLQSKEN